MLASAIGVALSASSVAHLAQAAEDTEQKGQRNSISLGATSITGEEQDNTSYQVEKASSQKYTAPLVDTPRSVTVVPQQVLKDTAATSLQDALRTVPGITFGAGEGGNPQGDRPFIRGFDAQGDTYLDGVRDTGGQSREIFDIESIEVSKGPNSSFGGRGSAGGSLNLVSKTPQARDFTNGGFTYGSDQKQKSFVDWYKQDKRVMYGALDIDLNDTTTLRTSLDYQNNDANGTSYGHIPLFYNTGRQTNFSRSFNPATRSSYMDNTSYNFTTMLDHKLDNDWSLKTAYSHQYSYRKGQGASTSGGYPDPVTGQGAGAFIYRLDSYQTQDTLDVYANGPFQLGGREHELVVGASTSRTHLNFPNYSSTLAGQDNDYGDVDNIFTWDGRQYGRRAYNEVGGAVTTLQQTGVYGALRLKPIDPLTIILGTRLSWWKQLDEVTDYAPYSKNTDKTKKTGVVTPYAGIIYDLNDTYSVYASYTDIFMPQENYNRDKNERLIEPDEGENYEIGLKGEYFDGRLNASFAYFQVKESNRSVPDDAYNNLSPTPPNYAFIGTKAVTKGFELEMSGELSPGWQVQAGYTHKIVRDDNGEKISTFEPQDQLKVSTSYKLKGDLDKFTVGGGARWQNTAWQNIYNSPHKEYQKFEQPDYWVVDLMTRYQISKNLSATLNVNNVFDKSYYTNIGFYNSAVYGEPRNFMVTTRWDF